MAEQLQSSFVAAFPYIACSGLGWIVYRVEKVLGKIHAHEVKLAVIDERCKLVGHAPPVAVAEEDAL